MRFRPAPVGVAMVALSLAGMLLVAFLLLMPVVPSEAADQKASAPQDGCRAIAIMTPIRS